MTKMPIQIKNNSAVAYWIVISIITAINAAFTYIFLRNGPPIGYSDPFIRVVLGLSWLFVSGAVNYAFSKPRVLVLVDEAKISVTLRYLFKTLRFDYSPDQILQSGIVESKDSEGNPHFTAQITMTDSRKIELTEGSHDICEHVMSQFESALRGQSRDNSGMEGILIPHHDQKLVARNKTARDGITMALSSIKGNFFGVVFSLLFILFGSAFAIDSWVTYCQNTDIQKNGPRAAGQVTKKSFSSGDSDCHVEYCFALPCGTQIHATHGISEEFWYTIEKGQTLTIAYSQEDPRQNIPLCQSVSLAFPIFASLLCALLVSFGGFLFWALVFAKPS